MNSTDAPKLEFLERLFAKKQAKSSQSGIEEGFRNEEQFFLGLFELGIFEVYQFLYSECQSPQQLEEWIIQLKGEQFYLEKIQVFEKWAKKGNNSSQEQIEEVLNSSQVDFWKEQGYLQLEGIIPKKDCDGVVSYICQELQVNLEEPNSWYPNHEKFQGLMVQLYQDPAIEKIRKNPLAQKVFAQLYQSNHLLPNTEKVSMNPPESPSFKFRGSPLHWDIDFQLGPRYYIQGLVYLQDVPIDRGAFCLIPKYHQRISQALEGTSPEKAIDKIRREEVPIYLSGKAGDLIVWLESIPHAASPNRSNLPRFVQYLSFTKLS